MFYDSDVSCSSCNLVFISIHLFWYHGRSVYLTQTSHIYGLAWFSGGSFLSVSVEEGVVPHFSFVRSFEKYWTACSSTGANSQSLSNLFRVSAQLLSCLFWCCSFCQSCFDASDSFCQSRFVASGLFEFRVSSSSYLTSSADDKRKNELRIMSRPCIEQIIWVWVD